MPTKKTPAKKVSKSAAKKATQPAAKKATKSVAKKTAKLTKPAKKTSQQAAKSSKTVSKKVAAPKSPVKKKTAKSAPVKTAAAKKKRTTTKAPVVKKSSKPAKTAPPVVHKSAPASQPKPVKPAPPKPAVPTEKVPAASAAFVKKQQQKLLDLRDEIMEAIYGVQRETIISATENSDTGNGQHQGDAGSDSYDRDLALSMLAKEQDAIHEIEKALDRIEKGTYGICEASGERIPQARLEALPFARLTVQCQAAWEEEQRTRGVLPSDYGFGAFNESKSSVSLDGADD